MASDAATRREDGQVLPALLLAVVFGVFLTAVLFIVGGAGDQSARAGTASDAAALAAGDEAATELRTFLSGDPGVHLGQVATGAGLDPTSLQSSASTYARANGADEQSTAVTGFSPSTFEWQIEVTVKARDVVRDNLHTAVQGTSTSRVSVRLDGLCSVADGFGFVLPGLGHCLTSALLGVLCAAPSPASLASPAPPAVTATPDPSATPVPPPHDPREDLPEWLHGHGCPASADLFAAMAPDVRLVE